MAQFLTILKVAPYGDGKSWCLLEDFYYQHDDGKVIVTPAKFITDFASVPRLFWNILPPWGKYGFIAVAHDWLYYDQSTTKEYADDVLMAGMKLMGVDLADREIIYEAVHKAGQAAWDENTKKKEKGFIRIAQDFPTSVMDLPFYWDGTTGDWKKG